LEFEAYNVNGLQNLNIIVMQNKLLIPGAILAAAILIGGALLFTGGGDDTDTTPTDTDDGNVTINPITNDDHILGSPDASIKFVEYSDIDCPFCANFHETMNRIVDEYGPTGEVAWVFRHFPLSQIHPDAETKAIASECVADIGGNSSFWNYLDALFEREDERRSDLAPMAAAIGVNRQAFEDCLDDGDFEDDVKEDAADAARAGAQGTPHTIIVLEETGERIPLSGAQPYEAVKEVIEAILADTTTAPTDTGTSTGN
jgi:protein-disulfide isomerase